MRRPATVRGRTTLLATAVVALALAVAGCAFVLLLQRTLTRNIDDTLAARADDVTSLLAGGASPTQAIGKRRDDFYIQLVGPDHRVLASSSTEPEGPLLAVPPPSGRPITASDLSIGEEGEDFRVTSRTVPTPGGPTRARMATRTRSLPAVGWSALDVNVLIVLKPDRPPTSTK